MLSGVEISERRATIKDVAHAAGVSPTTVSHALSGNRAVRRETHERIMRVAEELGYRPSALARGLREARIGLLALILRSLDSESTFVPEGVDYFLRFAGAAALTSMQHGYGLVLVPDPTKPGAPVSTLVADACIVTDPVENDPVLTLLEQQHMPFLAVGADPARPDLACLASSAYAETMLVLDHLREAGGARIALAVGTDRNEWNLASRRAYLDWCESAGMRPQVFENPVLTGVAGGERIAAQAFDGSPSPERRIDAIYCLAGRHAVGVVEAAQRRGIHVPQDLLVAAGSEVVQNRTGATTVTSLDLQPELVARQAVRIAVDLAEGRTPDVPATAPLGRLQVRESTSRELAEPTGTG